MPRSKAANSKASQPPSNSQANRTDTNQELKKIVRNLRVNELRVLLSFAGRDRTGLKCALQSRALAIVPFANSAIKAKIYELNSIAFPTNDHMYASGKTTPLAPPPNNKEVALNENLTATLQLNQMDLLSSALTTCQRFKPLAFYEIIDEIAKPVSIFIKKESYQVGGTSFYHYSTHFFKLTEKMIKLIKSSTVVAPSGAIEFGYQIQLRFKVYTAGHTDQQDDHIPSSLCIKLNSEVVPLPPALPPKTQNAEPRRLPWPINLTNFIKLLPTFKNTLEIKCFSSSITYEPHVMVVNLVHKIEATELIRRLKIKGVRPTYISKSLIKEKLNSESDCEISTTSLRVSLICPLGKTLMSLPCRATTCSHFQCFDASTYILMQEKNPKWICPVCHKTALYQNLSVDGYFMEILLNSATSSCHDIEFLQDASWKFATSKETQDQKCFSISAPTPKLKNQESITLSSTPSSNIEKATVTPAAKPAIETVTLDSSSDEDVSSSGTGVRDKVTTVKPLSTSTASQPPSAQPVVSVTKTSQSSNAFRRDGDNDDTTSNTSSSSSCMVSFDTSRTKKRQKLFHDLESSDDDNAQINGSQNTEKTSTLCKNADDDDEEEDGDDVELLILDSSFESDEEESPSCVVESRSSTTSSTAQNHHPPLVTTSAKQENTHLISLLSKSNNTSLLTSDSDFPPLEIPAEASASPLHSQNTDESTPMKTADDQVCSSTGTLSMTTSLMSQKLFHLQTCDPPHSSRMIGGGQVTSNEITNSHSDIPICNAHSKLMDQRSNATSPLPSSSAFSFKPCPMDDIGKIIQNNIERNLPPIFLPRCCSPSTDLNFKTNASSISSSHTGIYNSDVNSVQPFLSAGQSALLQSAASYPVCCSCPDTQEARTFPFHQTSSSVHFKNSAAFNQYREPRIEYISSSSSLPKLSPAPTPSAFHPSLLEMSILPNLLLNKQISASSSTHDPSISLYKNRPTRHIRPKPQKNVGNNNMNLSDQFQRQRFPFPNYFLQRQQESHPHFNICHTRASTETSHPNESHLPNLNSNVPYFGANEAMISKAPDQNYHALFQLGRLDNSQFALSRCTSSFNNNNTSINNQGFFRIENIRNTSRPSPPFALPIPCPLDEMTFPTTTPNTVMNDNFPSLSNFNQESEINVNMSVDHHHYPPTSSSSPPSTFFQGYNRHNFINNNNKSHMLFNSSAHHQ